MNSSIVKRNLFKIDPPPPHNTDISEKLSWNNVSLYLDSIAGRLQKQDYWLCPKRWRGVCYHSRGNITAMPNCQRINILEIIVRWLTPLLHQEWCTVSVLQMCGLPVASPFLVSTDFWPILPNFYRAQNNNGLEPIVVFHLCGVVQMCVALSIYARSYNAAASLGNCRLGVGCPDQKITWQPLALLDGCHEPRIALLQQLIRSTVARVGVGGWQCW